MVCVGYVTDNVATNNRNGFTFLETTELCSKALSAPVFGEAIFLVYNDLCLAWGNNSDLFVDFFAHQSHLRGFTFMTKSSSKSSTHECHLILRITFQPTNFRACTHSDHIKGIHTCFGWLTLHLGKEERRLCKFISNGEGAEPFSISSHLPLL